MSGVGNAAHQPPARRQCWLCLGAKPWEPLLEFDTTDNKFRDDLLTVPLDIQGQLMAQFWTVNIPNAPGIGVTPDPDFIAHYELSL